MHHSMDMFLGRTLGDALFLNIHLDLCRRWGEGVCIEKCHAESFGSNFFDTISVLKFIELVLIVFCCMHHIWDLHIKKPIDYTLSKTLGVAFDLPLFAQHHICRPSLPQKVDSLEPTTVSNVQVVYIFIVYVPIVQDYHVLVLSHKFHLIVTKITYHICDPKKILSHTQTHQSTCEGGPKWWMNKRLHEYKAFRTLGWTRDHPSGNV